MYKYATLQPDVLHILKGQGTEPPFSGAYCDTDALGTYLCRGCGVALFRSSAKFLSSCGWPSFDDEIVGAITRKTDADGHRTEICCANCDGHLGHVFIGEHLTVKNLRHCVNSLAIEFVPNLQVNETQEAIVAGGCFWGVQHYLAQLNGVLLTEVGYTGGDIANPSYQTVCTQKTGHVEAVRIVFDPDVVSYESIIKYFFEIHNPAQSNGQGPDIGAQYLSCIFYFDEEQKLIVEKLIAQVKAGGVDVTTKVKAVSPFWVAETEHQHYYKKNGLAPYCHQYTKRFE